LAGVLLLLRISPTLLALGTALLVPPAAVMACSFYLVRRISATGAMVAPAEIASPFSVSVFVRDVLPIGAGIVLSALYFRIDLFLVQHWRGLEEVATYNAVFRLVDALRLFPAALLTVLLPAVFRRRDALFSLTLFFGLLVFGLSVAAVLYLGAPQMISLTYGSKYTTATPVLRVLSFAFPVLCVNYGLTHQVIGWARPRVYAYICGLALVLNVAINLVLIPSMGSAGAAWATLWTEVALTIAWIGALSKARRRGR
jgi:O-antigen/teichoic acid export membrane protein